MLLGCRRFLGKKHAIDTFFAITNQQQASTHGGTKPAQAKAEETLSWELCSSVAQNYVIVKTPKVEGFQMRESSSLHI